MAAQDAHADRVKRAEPRHALDHAADDLADAAFHFARGLVGEGHGQNFAWTGAAGGEDVRNADGEHAGFTGAGAGQHQHRSVKRFDRLPLFGVQPGEVGRARAAGAGPRGNAAGRRFRCRGLERVVVSQGISQSADHP